MLRNKNTIINNRTISIITIFTLFILIFGSISVVIFKINITSATDIEDQGTKSRGNIIISNNTTWTLANSPYNINGNVLVEHNITLTIDPGVIVKFGNGNYLQVEGKLIADGTKDKMITFTSNKNKPAPGDWDSIKFMNDPDNGSSIKYCNIEYASWAIFVDENNPTLQPYAATPNITYNYISNCSSGISYNPRNPSVPFFNPSNVIAFNTINTNGNGIGIEIENANVLIHNNTLQNYVGENRGISCHISGGNLTIKYNVITGYKDGIYFSNSWTSNVNIIKNLIVNNSGNGIEMGNWKNDGLDSFFIENNTLYKNNKGIHFYGTPEKLKIVYNTISFNNYGIDLLSELSANFPNPPDHYIFNNNNIFNNTLYNVNNGQSKSWGNWSFKNNWWGTTITNSINHSIYDYYDDFNLGKVLYAPFSTKLIRNSAPNLPPSANAGQDQNVTVNQSINFDGSGSNDPNGDTLTYNWSFGDGKSTGWLNQNTTSHSYTMPGNYTVMLTVSDGLLRDMDTCFVRVLSKNQPPIANTGSNQNVTVNQTTNFDGSGSYDPDGDPLTFNWSFGDGISTGWQNQNTTSHSYTFPGNYTVTLRVSDGELNDTDTCFVQVSAPKVNQPPVANAGPNQYVIINQTVTFDGTSSSDPDGDNITYNWDFGDGTSTGWQNSSKTSHSYNKLGNYTVTLNVSDGSLTDTDTCIVRVFTQNYSPSPPKINDIPDIYVHYYNPDTEADDNAYSYDFSYFINDPDTSRSELIVWVQSIMADDNDAWLEKDPKNNMRLIFKFPFSAAGKHILIMYVQDPDPRTEMAYRHFNVIVIIDAWPVALIKSIPDQSFLEDDVLDNAFKITDYFKDRDGQAGGTDYSIVENPGAKVKAVIDEDKFVDLSSNETDWNGEEEVVILAKDTNPVHYVYAIFKVKVIPVDDGNGSDSDNDGIPDAWEIANGLDPQDPLDAFLDPDNDALSNLEEYYLNTNPKNKDTDGDGYIDSEDAYPLDPKKWEGDGTDTDGDGLPDTWELFYGLNPNNPMDALLDSDGDNLTNLQEYKLGTNPIKTDTDGDGVTDNKDDYPTDPTRSKKTKTNDKDFVNTNSMLIIVGLIVVILILTYLTMFILKNKRMRVTKPFNDDKLIRKVRDEIIYGKETRDLDIPTEELQAMLEGDHRNGKISEETYNFIHDKNLIDDHKKID